MATLTEDFHAAGFIVSEAPNTLSRDQIVVASGQNLKAGTVLGKLANATSGATSAAGGSNTGNGVMGAVTLSAGAKAGAYKVEITTPATNGGEFDVYDPNGAHVGQGKVAVAFSGGGLAFTLADGATDFIAGDVFTITVPVNANAAQYAAFDPTAADGSQNAAAILYGPSDATSAAKNATALTRNCEVNSSELVWGANVTTGPQKTAALAQLAALGIIAR